MTETPPEDSHSPSPEKIKAGLREALLASGDGFYWLPVGGSPAAPWLHGGNAHAYLVVRKGQVGGVLVDAGRTFAFHPESGHEGGAVDLAPLFTDADGTPPLVSDVLLTHGHDDHMGSLALQVGAMPTVHGSPMALALMEQDCARIGGRAPPAMRALAPGDRLKLGGLEIEPVSVTHSIGGAFGFLMRPEGGEAPWHFHSGDIKVDQTALVGPTTDLDRLGSAGEEGVGTVLIDASGVGKDGMTREEAEVRAAYADIFRAHPNQRTVVGVFGHYQERIADIVKAAAEARPGNGPLIFGVEGGTLLETLHASRKVGFDWSKLAGREVRFVEERAGQEAGANPLPADRFILATGQYAEPKAPLMKALTGDPDARFTIGKDDLMVIGRALREKGGRSNRAFLRALIASGAELVLAGEAPLESSGHGQEGDLQLVLANLKPQAVYATHVDGPAQQRAAAKFAQWGFASAPCFNGTLHKLGAKGFQPVAAAEFAWSEVPINAAGETQRPVDSTRRAASSPKRRVEQASP